MSEKIESLTQEQIDAMPRYVDKWLKIGLNTDPVDFDNAVKAAKLMYKAAGLPEPTQFYTAKSPIDAIRVIQGLDPSLSESDIFNEMIYGAHDASWIAFYDFFEKEVGLDFGGKLEGLRLLAESAGWCNMYEDVVVFQDRPILIKFDDEDRLHNEFGPAIEYSDGFGIYAWHGTQIPSEWITDKANLKAETALKWENIEQRRCACEILGWARILRELDATEIDADPDPEIGVLVEVDIPDIGKERFLKVLCGTRREFALPVPPDIKTALSAQAWTFGFDVDEFIPPEVRT